MGKKGFLAGILIGAATAATGYIYYKSLSSSERDQLMGKVDDVVENARDKVVDYTYAATDAVAIARDRADEFVADNSISEKMADLKAQAFAKANDLRDRAQDKTDAIKDQIRDKIAPELQDDEIDDIVLSPDAPLLADALNEAYEEDDDDLMSTNAASNAERVVLKPQQGLSESDEIGLSETK